MMRMSGLVGAWFVSCGAAAVTIDFEGSPPSGPFEAPDLFTLVELGECNGFDDRARILDDEYRTAGVASLSPIFPMQLGGGFQPDGTPDPDDNSMLISLGALTECPATESGLAPLTIVFATGQTSVSFDIWMQVYELGESFPVDLLDSSGTPFSTMTLTPADAVIPVPPVGGRFVISSGTAYYGLRIGLTTTSSGATGGFFLDNLSFDPEPACPWDCDGSGDGAVGVIDLLALLAQYDPQPPVGCAGGSCDFDGDECVSVVDLLSLLAHYDPSGLGCP